jgi:hypothetical protein
MLVKMRDSTLTNPFVVGEPIAGDSLFIGRQSIFIWLQEQTRKNGGSTPLILEGMPGIGKTSILKQVMSGRLNEGIIPVYFDLNELPSESLSDFLWSIAKSTMKSLELHGFQEPSLEKRLLVLRPWQAFNQHFWQYIPQAVGERKILFAFDNFNSIVNNGRDNEKLAVLRQRLFSLFESQDNIQMLVTLTGRFEAFDLNSLAPFQNARNQRVPAFTEDETNELLRQAGSFPIFSDLVSYIYELTGGHPGDIQRLCHTLHERGRKNRLRQITLADIVFALENNFQPRDFHTAVYRRKSEHSIQLSERLFGA